MPLKTKINTTFKKTKKKVDDKNQPILDGNTYYKLYRSRIAILLVASQIFESTRPAKVKAHFSEVDSLEIYLDDLFSGTNTLFTQFELPVFDWTEYQNIVNAALNGIYKIRTNALEKAAKASKSDITTKKVAELPSEEPQHFIVLQKNDVLSFHGKVKWMKPNKGEVNFLDFLPSKAGDDFADYLIQDEYDSDTD